MDFDYVIVGGGSAGSVLAARLSEDPATSVCLLEAGGKGDGLLVRVPAAVVAMLPGRPKINNWGFEGLQRASDDSPFKEDELDDDDARELRLGPLNWRLMGADIGYELLANREGQGDYAFGLPITGLITWM